jgi:hypothetical protein
MCAAADTLVAAYLNIPTCVWPKLILVGDLRAGNIVWGYTITIREGRILS